MLITNNGFDRLSRRLIFDDDQIAIDGDADGIADAEALIFEPFAAEPYFGKGHMPVPCPAEVFVAYL